MNSSHATTDAQARHQGPTPKLHHPSEPHHALQDYPELEPVLTAAVNAAVASFYPEKIDGVVRTYLDRVTTAATVAIYAPIAAHVEQTARGGENSRAAQSRVVAQAAAKVTTRVMEAAADLQAQAEASVEAIAQTASAAAAQVAAAAADLERARAAAIVAQAAIEAAEEVAAAAEREAAAVHQRVLESAATARALWLETCFRFAATFAGSAAEAVLANGMPCEVTDDPPPLVLADWVIYEACRPLTSC